MSNNLNGSSRFTYRSKRKKTNLVLNGLIAVVILLIVVVAVSIFSSGNNNAANNAAAPQAAHKADNANTASGQNQSSNNSNAKSDQSNNNTATADQTNQSSGTNQSQSSQQSNDSGATGQTDQSQTVAVNGGNSQDGQQTAQSPAGNNAATPPSGQHTASYDENSTDWQEQLQAISYATGIPQNNMTVWFLGRDGSSNASVGTVEAKDTKQKYKVHIQWVDGQGWKPVKVEKIN